MRRSQMTGEERECRSRLKPYVGYQELVRGSLTVRKHTCGKPNCKCAKTGYKHRSLYLTARRKGKVEQIYIPREKGKMVAEWVENYRTVQGLLEKISSTYWDRLKRKG
jgi:hypothetical protein